MVKVETLGEIFKGKGTRAKSRLYIKEYRISETEIELDLTHTFIIPVKLPASTMFDLDNIAAEQGKTKSDMVKEWIHSFLAISSTEQSIIIRTYNKSPGKDVKVFTLRLVYEIVKELDKIASMNNVSRSEVLRAIIAFKVESYKRVKNNA